MSCECYQIGGPFIAEDPDCPEHGREAQERDDELAALRKDAARYRWLRNRKPGGTYRIAGLVYSDGNAAFDAAIDAAMAAEAKA